MTDHRTLKKLVRERMARTGERYTTAHRHVTAQAATHPDGALAALAVEGYPAFAPTTHRPSALARALLGHAGLDVSEPMACGLGGGIGFLYAVFEYREVSTPLLTVVAQHHPQPWLDAVAEHLGLALRTVTSSRPAPALAKLDALLDEGRPAQVVVASGGLPWHEPSRPEAGAEPGAVVVAGRRGDTYLVDEGDGEPHTLQREVLAGAWAAHRKGRFAITTVDGVREVTPEAARAAVRTTHAHLTGPVLGHSFDANLGLSGMRRLAADLADDRTARGWRRRFGEGEAFLVGTSRLAECLTSAYTAPGGTRPLYAEFLQEVSSRWGLPLDDAAALAAQAGAVWTEVADVAGATVPDDEPGAVLDRLAALVESAVSVEERLAEALGAG